MKIEPLNDYVLISPIELKKETKSGLVLAETVDDMSYRGEIVAVGPGKMNDDGKVLPMRLKVGDIIAHKRYGLTSIEVDGKDHFFLRESEVLAKVKK